MHGNVGRASGTTRGLRVAGIAGEDVALWEPTQGAAVAAQVYVAAADQQLTSSSDFLRVHEFHRVLIGPGISTGPRGVVAATSTSQVSRSLWMDGSDATADERRESSNGRRFSLRETSRSAHCGVPMSREGTMTGRI